MKKYLPHISILTAGILWGMIGLFTRGLLSGEFSPRAIVQVRNFGDCCCRYFEYKKLFLAL